MNIGITYKNQKKNVIDLFEKYLDNRGDTHDGNNIIHWKKRVENLDKDKYTITVAGEISSGKSTFLNALLGVELLPTGVRQLTSAIVELSKSEMPFLEVSFADGSKKRFENHNTVTEKLSELCAIPEQYQTIPTTLIDSKIQQTNEALIVNDQFITNLEKSSGNKNLSRRKDLIKKYIKNREEKDIPVEINVGYPLKWDFDELRLVDSPGVNALGGVQDITFNYLNTSNAVLFVQNIQPLELKSFREFVENQITSSSRDKNTLFLVLTHAGLHPNGLIESQIENAIELYSDLIPPERILAVDSLSKVIHSQILAEVSLEEIEQENEYKEDLIIKAQKRSKKEGISIEDYLLKISRFDILEKTIEDFAMEAPKQQLEEIVDTIKKGYWKLEGLYDEQIEDLKLKRKNPDEFEKLIESKIIENDKWKKVIKKIPKTNAFQDKFRANNPLKSKFDDILLKFYDDVTAAENTNIIRKHFSESIEKIRSITNDYEDSIIEYLNNHLNEESKKFKTKHSIIPPDIPIDRIDEKIKGSAWEKENVYKEKDYIALERRWYTLFLYEHETLKKKRVKVGQKNVFNDAKYLEKTQVHFQKEMREIIKFFKEESSKLLNKYEENYYSKVDRIIADRQEGLSRLKSDKEKNKDLIKRIDDLKTKKKDWQPEYLTIKEIQEELF